MRILFCTSEAVPFAKTGGLADVSGALPAALAAVGCDVRVVLPRYGTIPTAGLSTVGRVDVEIAGQGRGATIYEGSLPGVAVPVWLIDRPEYFDRPGLYGESGQDYTDNLERFTFFSRAILAWAGAQPWRPDVIHCNDWQTALVPVCVAAQQGPATPTLLTIHNLAYQGVFPAAAFPVTGLPQAFFAMSALEFWGQVNVLKGGLVCATVLSTVSETYAREIQTPEYGAGLDGVLRERSADLFGILNGVDYGAWDPATDSLIPAKYTPENLEGKTICKHALQQECGLPTDPAIPVIGMVTRLADQKGLDLVAATIEAVLDRGVQCVLLGTGDPRYHALFGELAARRPSQVGVRLGFDNRLAHLIEAGADIFLMPSRYEPSGLNQLYSLRYGTVPVVRRTGGLADSIVDVTPRTLADGTANGFVFDEYTPAALLAALRRALETFRTPAVWRQVQLRGMRADFSWAGAARRYRRVYDQAAARYGGRTPAPGR